MTTDDNDLIDFGPDEFDKWLECQRSKMGDYDNPENGCPNCSRHRVMKGEDGKHRCEKCAFCIEDDDYDLDFSEYLK